MLLDMPSRSRDDDRWNAIVRRERASTDFFFAVRTTGVVCVPGCASRAPRRENVELFDTLAEAVLRGFRPCKRCKPAGDDAPAIVRAAHLLSTDEATTPADAADAVGLSRAHFQRAFKAALGVTPGAWARHAKRERARAALAAGRDVTEAVHAAGYGSASRFYDGAGRELGMAPRKAKAGGAGETLTYAVARCSLGALLVAWTARGVAAVALGDDRRAVLADLRRSFPRATHVEGSSTLVAAVLRVVDGDADPRLPIDLRGTAFQVRVWEALRAIPKGETRTYASLAADLGVPAGARAVAGACAANRVAIAVPCHRVVRGDGDLAGYRWGTDRKAAVLEREGARARTRR